jgi:hypothetical protein
MRMSKNVGESADQHTRCQFGFTKSNKQIQKRGAERRQKACERIKKKRDTVQSTADQNELKKKRVALL